MHIKVKVNAGAKREACEQKSDGTFKISVKEPAKDGMANQRILELISGHFGGNSRPKIVIGKRSKNKIIELKN